MEGVLEYKGGRFRKKSDNQVTFKFALCYSMCSKQRYFKDWFRFSLIKVMKLHFWNGIEIASIQLLGK